MSITILADREPLTRPQAIETARRMWANGEGWSPAEIRRYLADRGHPVHLTTIRHWADEDYARRRLASDRPRGRRRRREQRGSTRFRVFDHDAYARLGEPIPPDLLLAMRVEDGLSYATIAKVARRFFGVELTEHQVRSRLYALGARKNPNKARRKAAA